MKHLKLLHDISTFQCSLSFPAMEQGFPLFVCLFCLGVSLVFVLVGLFVYFPYIKTSPCTHISLQLQLQL